MSENEKITTETILFTDTDLPITSNQVMGQYNIYLENVLIESIPIKAKDSVYIWGWKEIINTIFYQFLTFS